MSKASVRRTAGCAVLLGLLAAGPAAAQEGGWSYSLTGYLWMSATDVTADTRFGPVSSRLSFSDALDDLKFGLMGTLEARNGPWGFVGDLLYLNLGSEGGTPGPVFDTVLAETKLTAFSGYALYRVHEDPTFSFDVGVGLRAFSTDVDITFVGPATQTQGQSKTWVDPLVVARMRVAFNQDWFGTAVLDAGATGSTNTWQGLASVGYRINDNWSVQGGYRYMRARWDTDDGRTTLEFSGPIFGATYRF